MLIKKEKIEDLEFMDVEPEDEEVRSIGMEKHLEGFVPLLKN